MLLAKDFVILRDIPASPTQSHPVDRQPIRVATLINEAEFNARNHGLLHRRTVFFEDRKHDWDWDDGRFRFYSRLADKADVILVFEEGEVSFCSQCGAAQQPGPAGKFTDCGCQPTQS